MRLLHLVGYRGNSAEYPENTIPALRSALSLGVRFIELDVHLSAEGVPMVCNEQELARLAGDDIEMSSAQMAATDVSQKIRFGERFSGVRMPSLITALSLLQGRPEVTVFVVLGRASVSRLGHDQVISQVVRALKPFRSRCVLVSRDLATVHRARLRAEYPIGWVIPTYDAHTRLKSEAVKPEYLFCDRRFLPASGALWRGPWRWAVYDVPELDLALDLANRGASFVVTGSVRTLGDAMRRHAAARAARTFPGGTTTGLKFEPNATAVIPGATPGNDIVSSDINIDDVAIH
jgi:glycerophosphoryl diester phosphodiesterase